MRSQKRIPLNLHYSLLSVRLKGSFFRFYFDALY